MSLNALLTGRPGGQTLIGGTISGKSLGLQSNDGPGHESDQIVVNDPVRLVVSSNPKGAVVLPRPASIHESNGGPGGIKMFATADEVGPTSDYLEIIYANVPDPEVDAFIIGTQSRGPVATKPIRISGNGIKLSDKFTPVWNAGPNGFYPDNDVDSPTLGRADIGLHNPADPPPINVPSRLRNINQLGYVEMSAIADPAVANVGAGRAFVRDNGAGKLQVCVKFPNNQVVVLATEP